MVCKISAKERAAERAQNELVKWNFLHTLHLNDLIRPIIWRSRISKQKSKYGYEEKKNNQLTT